MALDPLKVAIWRFEQIAPLLDHCLSDTQRSLLIGQMASVPQLWPSGKDRPVAKSTLYQWLGRYQADPRIESLLPAARKPTATPCCIKPQWIEHALALVEEEPARSLFILTRRIQSDFALSSPPSRSSLQRALASEPRYVAVRMRHRQPRRTHFAAAKVHQLWHGDAKADFTVRFIDGSSRKVRILSILDDCSRYIVAALVVASESLVAVCSSFANAVSRYGLPEAFYADRGSPYDSYIFRQGLAVLGVRRINTKPRNPSAHGKIEAYHRPLGRWFIKELPHQPLTDLTHLQRLLDAFIDQLYNRHYHRELKKSPFDAFNNTISLRTVSIDRIHQAFLKFSTQLPHRKTGTVRVNGTIWNIPSRYLIPRRHLRIAEDVLDSSRVYLIDAQGQRIPLKPAVRIMTDTNASGPVHTQDLPIGSLSALLESYRGRTLPQAIRAFGLPEIYQILAAALGRVVPDTEQEATRVLQWLKEYGPFQPAHFSAAVDNAVARLGQGRTLCQLLDELSSICKRSTNSNKGNRP
jgi:transposase InsO family protein